MVKEYKKLVICRKPPAVGGNRYRDPQSDIRWSLWNPAEEGKKNCRSERGEGYLKKTHRMNRPGLTEAHRN